MVAGDQYQIVPASGETVGVNRADASGGASDENSRASSHDVGSISGTWIEIAANNRARAPRLSS